MFTPSTVLAAVAIYMGILFAAAMAARRQGPLARRVMKSPWLYSLSLAVYCTSWTYYGSVGKAATSGFLFLTIYLGPTLAFCLGWFVIARLIRIQRTHRVTSIADFISARYGKSALLAALATLMALAGIAPYIALQLKAVIDTFRLVVDTAAPGGEWVVRNLSTGVVVLMVGFTILFGARRLDASERNPGLVAAVGLECVVKLVAFLAAGLFVTYGVFNGFGDLFERLGTLSPDGPAAGLLAQPSYTNWATFTLLAASAVWFLPRQFQMAVVEADEPDHVRSAMWQFPLYLFLINLFVFPIAAAGILTGHPLAQADTFVLRLPLEYGSRGLGLFVFLGGFSAATGMIMVSTVALATMVTNHLVLPVIDAVPALGRLRSHLLQCRWVAVATVIGIGYLTERHLADSYMLVNMGMISFAAVLQFAPPVLVGLFWRQASRRAATWGLVGGFGMWVYTLVIPAMAKSGWIPGGWLEAGPWGFSWLAPGHLGGLVMPDPYTHAVFWSLVANLGLLVGISAAAPARGTELALADEFLAPAQEVGGTPTMVRGDAHIEMTPKIDVTRALFERYHPGEVAEQFLEQCLHEARLGDATTVSITQLADLTGSVERLLAGSLGAASAHRAVHDSSLMTPEEQEELKTLYSKILVELAISPARLREKVDYYHERAEMLEAHSRELARKVEEAEREIEARLNAEADKVRLYHSQRSLSRILKVTFEVGTLADQLGRALDLVLRAPHLALEAQGAIFLTERDKHLHLSVQRGLSPQICHTCDTVPPGVCLCGRALATGEIQTLTADDPEHTDRIQGSPSHGHQVFPLGPPEAPIGVLCLYTAPHLVIDADARNFLEGATDAITGIIQRKQAEKALQDAHDRLEVRVEERTLALSTTVAQLQQAHGVLQQTQSQLVQQAKLASIGQLAAGVAHEINNPLGFVASNFNTLSGYFADLKTYADAVDASLVDPATTAEKVAAARAAADLEYILGDLEDIFSESAEGFERIRSIVLSLKGFARVDAVHKLEPYDLNEGIRSTLVVAQNEVKYVADVEMELEELHPVMAAGNEINQVLLNLLVNAAQAIGAQERSEGSRGRITVRTFMDGERVCCQVCDDGPGMSPDVRDRVFDPFFTTKPVGKGTGLGLNIAYDIVVNQHGGDIRVESEPGKGSAFTLSLPREPAQVVEISTA